LLEGRSRPKQIPPSSVTLQSPFVSFDKVVSQPWRRSLIFRNSDEERREEFTRCFQKQMEPGAPLIQSPHFQLLCELRKTGTCQKISQFKQGRRHAAGDLVSSDA